MTFESHPPETVTIGPAVIRWTDARHGNCGFAVSHQEREALVPGAWTYVHQTHSADVLVTDRTVSGDVDADAIVTSNPNLVIGVQTADCAPIALIGDHQRGAIHAGWKGLRSGIVARTVEHFDDGQLLAALGPCIHVDCYQFGADLLADFRNHWGDEVVDGNHFDLPAAVRIECERVGVELRYMSPHCTACSGCHYSHRALQSPERQVMLVGS